MYMAYALKDVSGESFGAILQRINVIEAFVQQNKALFG